MSSSGTDCLVSVSTHSPFFLLPSFCPSALPPPQLANHTILLVRAETSPTPPPLSLRLLCLSICPYLFAPLFSFSLRIPSHTHTPPCPFDVTRASDHDAAVPHPSPPPHPLPATSLQQQHSLFICAASYVPLSPHPTPPPFPPLLPLPFCNHGEFSFGHITVTKRTDVAARE